MRARPIACAVLLLVTLAAGSAAADLPPPAGFVETCTAAIQQKPGTECYTCSSYHGSVEKCPTRLGPTGLTKACQSHGGSVWSEVWCRPAGGPPLPPEAAAEAKPPTAAELAAPRPAPAPASSESTPPGRGGCGACALPGLADRSSGGLAALAALLALASRRRGGRWKGRSRC